MTNGCEKCAYWQYVYIAAPYYPPYYPPSSDATIVIAPYSEQRCTYPPCKCKEEEKGVDTRWSKDVPL
jgi:hypothetical protein